MSARGSSIAYLYVATNCPPASKRWRLLRNCRFTSAVGGLKLAVVSGFLSSRHGARRCPVLPDLLSFPVWPLRAAGAGAKSSPDVIREKGTSSVSSRVRAEVRRVRGKYPRKGDRGPPV